MELEDTILNELKGILEDAEVSPLPADEYLSGRIGQRLSFFKTSQAARDESEIDPDKFTSPVCFVKSDEVQPDYRIHHTSLSQIDRCIDQLISKEC